MKERCAEYAGLQSEVSSILQRVSELTTEQLDAFQSNDQARFVTLDHELETAIGEKERTIGAMRQHVREHGCQPARALPASA